MAQGQNSRWQTNMPSLEWLPEESLFSICSRFHHFAGHPIPTVTSLALFHSIRAGASHDFPSHLNAFIQTTQGELGTAEEIIFRHTLLPFYLPFHPANVTDNWLAKLKLGSEPGLKAQIGLAASQFGAAHPLKACPACMAKDESDFGVAYWHVTHQIPGVFICHEHGTWLSATTYKVSGVERFGWILPRQAGLEPINWSANLPHRADALANACRAIWRLSSTVRFDIDKLTQIYRERLIDLEICNLHRKKIDHAKFTFEVNALVNDCGMAAVWPWTRSETLDSTFGHRLLRMCGLTSPRRSRHPLNHVSLILLLFKTWDTFWDVYLKNRIDCTVRGCSDDEIQVPREPFSNACPNDPQKIEFIETIHGGASISRAAQMHGISVGKAMTWAAQQGITPSRRPKTFKPDMRDRLITLLRKGIDKVPAADEVGVSIQTVTRLLLSEPRLHDEWTSKRFARAKSQAQRVWTRTMNALPLATSNTWRKIEPAAYAWLYRNDRTWLQQSIQNRQCKLPTPPRHRDWKQRDDEFAQSVRNAAASWHSTHTKKKPTLAQLCAIVKGLRPKLSAIRKLPLTQAAIKEVCSSRKSSAA